MGKNTIQIVLKTLGKEDKKGFVEWLVDNGFKRSYAYNLSNGVGKKGNAHNKRGSILFSEFANERKNKKRKEVEKKHKRAKNKKNVSFENGTIRIVPNENNDIGIGTSLSGTFGVKGDSIEHGIRIPDNHGAKRGSVQISSDQIKWNLIEKSKHFKVSEKETVCLVKFKDGTKIIVSKEYKLPILEVDKISTVEIVPIRL